MRRRQLWLLTSPGIACWALVAMTQQQTSHLGMVPFPISRRSESQTAINPALALLHWAWVQEASKGFTVASTTARCIPQKRGENYIYEGLILRFLKSFWHYHDTTNVVGYYAKPVQAQPVIPHELSMLDKGFFSGHRMVIDPAMALHLVWTTEDLCRTLWVFRYYDLDDRQFKPYGESLVRLIDFIRAIASMRDGSAPMEEVYYRGDQYVIERAGKPMAAIVPLWHLEEWLKRREWLFGMVDEVRQRRQDGTPEVIEEDIQNAIRTIRAENQRPT